MSSSQAEAATTLDGEKVGEDLELVVKISDPAHKQDRHGAIYEGRELFISNVPWTATWKDLKALFSQCGSVESARIPRKVDNSSKGIGFVAFRHREDAVKGLAMNMTNWKGRVLNVAESTNDTAKRQASVLTTVSQGTSASPAPSASLANGASSRAASVDPPATSKREEIQARTLILLNIPDTVNDARVRALAEPYGDLVHVALRLNHQGAIVEYKDQASVGRASLALEGHEIAPGRALRIGTFEDLKAMRTELRDDKIGTGPKKIVGPLPPPTRVRRPGVGAGRRGGKGGLGTKKGDVGLSGERATDAAAPDLQEADGEGEKGKTKSKPKSNADFKAMMLKR